MQDFEKLGAFYLGKQYDPDKNESRDELLLYDAKDLTTHAVCVGMTGSGKTGLCLALLEEAAIDGVPAIIIDPKGDLGNLLLTFPQLDPSDFRPWIDESEATRHGATVDEYAATVAQRWRDGLAQWGQDGARIARFRDSVDLTIYTPGSSAGVPLTVLRSFDAPPPALASDDDAFRERVASAASGLLALLDIDADPIKSREHILISKILDQTWREQRDLDIEKLIASIQTPPFEKIGVFDLDIFFPPKDRLALAMALNNLLASPSFSSWLEGEPLNIKRLLYTPEGQPRLSIISIAHLSDAERMFFLTILLNEILAWVRLQPGSSSLRALLYMDEVFGFFPPTANPPTKKPMLTLLKQARAFGLGVVLATQNPVDLDYKGLSNAGTWFLGRLQTERDKARVLEGLEGASIQAGAAFDRQKMEAILARLGSRLFLMNNVHEDQPIVFQTRWAMSYLRGPLTRSQIATLMAPRKTAHAAEAPPAQETTDASFEEEQLPVAASVTQTERPQLPTGIDELFAPLRNDIAVKEGLIYRPSLLGSARLHFVRVTLKVDHWEDHNLVAAIDGDSIDGIWPDSKRLPAASLAKLGKSPKTHVPFTELPEQLLQSRTINSLKKKLIDQLYQTHVCEILQNKKLKLHSNPGEKEDDFRIRLAQAAHERRDQQLEKLRLKYAEEQEKLQRRIQTARQRLAKEKSEYRSEQLDTAVSWGSTLMGALFGRKITSRTNVDRVSSSMRRLNRASDQRGDVKERQEDLQELQAKADALNQEFEAEVEQLSANVRPDQFALESVKIKPRKSQIEVDRLAIVWRPWLVDQPHESPPA